MKEAGEEAGAPLARHTTDTPMSGPALQGWWAAGGSRGATEPWLPRPWARREEGAGIWHGGLKL